jgi:hypothetical protein
MSRSAGSASSVHLDGGVLTSSLGAAVLRDVPAAVTTRPFGSTFDGLVLGINSDQPTSCHELRLGKVWWLGAAA